MEKDKPKSTCCPGEINKKGQPHSSTVEDTLAEKLIASIAAINVDVEGTISKELERIVKEKTTLGVILNQLLLELEDEVNNKVFKRVPGSEDRIEEIKLEIEQYERKIFSQEVYIQQLSRSLKLLKETAQRKENESGGGGGDEEEKGKKDNTKTRQMKKNSFVSASPTMSSSSSTVSSNVSDRRNHPRDWRKPTFIRQDVCNWKIITPKILDARQHLIWINDKLDVELRKQQKTGRSPSKAMMWKLENLKKEICEYERDIKEEEERAVNVYKSVILSQDFIDMS